MRAPCPFPAGQAGSLARQAYRGMPSLQDASDTLAKSLALLRLHAPEGRWPPPYSQSFLQKSTATPAHTSTANTRMSGKAHAHWPMGTFTFIP